MHRGYVVFIGVWRKRRRATKVLWVYKVYKECDRIKDVKRME